MNMVQRVPINPVEHALNPERKKLLDVYWLPEFLLKKEWVRCGIRVAALVAFQRLAHIKMIPAYVMLMAAYQAGFLNNVEWIVVDSSGNTAHGIARLAVALGFKVKVVLSTDVPENKIGILTSLPEVEVIAVSSSVAVRAREEAQKPGHYHLNQYVDPNNTQAHFLYTGPEMLRLLGDDLAYVAISMGTGGTAAGVEKFFIEQSVKRKIDRRPRVIGVRPILGEDVPGARDEERGKVSELLWRDRFSEQKIIKVTRKEAFKGMRELWGGLAPQPGPTSGLAWRGLQSFLDMHLATLSEHELFMLRGKTVAFLCPDDGRFYTERLSGELRPEQGVVLPEVAAVSAQVELPLASTGRLDGPKTEPVWARPKNGPPV